MPTTAVHHVSGLAKPVDILLDRWGIPHIYAASLEDLFFAQGYNAARDRLFQLDLWRRRGLGQLAEAFGPDFVERDRAARLLLYRGDMDAEWRAYGPATRVAVTRFVAGINAYIDRLDRDPEALPPEFALAGYRPARWSPDDLVRPRTHAPVFNLLSQFQRARVTAAAGVESDKLRQHLVRGHRPAVPHDIDLDLPPEVLDSYLLATGRPPPPMPKDTVEGSNCWALAAERTTTGRPLLAGDPHRGYSTPSLRYISHLSAPGLDVIGAGEPHMPGIALGHNGTAAFGFTVCPADTEDLVVCDLDTEPLETVVETITVQDGAPVAVELQFTAHGPVLHVDPDRGKVYALRSTWFEPGTAPYLASLDYLSATSWTEFDKALENWRAPGENHVYADVHGTIATRSAGLVPKREGYDGLLPIPADTRRYRWDGFFTPTDFARISNPVTGFIASANEFNVPDGYPLPTYEWPSSDRYTRIVQVLGRTHEHSPRESALLQNDLFSITAHEVIGSLRTLDPRSADDEVATAVELLTGWNAIETADSAAAALFETWWTRHLGPAVVQLTAHPAAVGFIPYPDPTTVREWLRTSPVTGERDRLLRQTLRAACDELRRTLGPSTATWRWGDLHRNIQPHPLGHLDESLHVGPVPTGGSNSTVASGSYWPADFSPFLGASFRMIIDVGEWDNSLCVNTPGQSGDPRSPHYRDLFETWQAGQYVPLLYTRTAIEQHTEQRIHLEAVHAE
ncbi:penicillin acylase family protein [Nocardia barduliensis]|uniref:penicillin acylase family protein n=1 Tax=Nocardia barduliensis TaxID=2736643 RepID=UPI00157329A3|nr:penicillin acylase family protein [Nocardia barduliensis]